MFFYLLKLQIKSRLQYGRALLYDFISGMLIFLFDIIPLLAIIQTFTFSNQWSTIEVLFLYSLARAGRVLGDLVFWGPMTRMDFEVQQGTLDKYLLAPINSFSYYVGQNFSTFTIGHCLMSVIVAIILFFFVDISFTFTTVISFFLIFIGGSLFYAACLIIFGSFPFWMIGSSGIFGIFSSLTKFSNYPLTFYPRILRRILTFVIPVAVTGYYPAVVLLGKEHIGFAVSGIIFLFGISIFLAAQRFWWYGIKSYQGTGSYGNYS